MWDGSILHSTIYSLAGRVASPQERNRANMGESASGDVISNIPTGNIGIVVSVIVRICLVECYTVTIFITHMNETHILESLVRFATVRLPWDTLRAHIKTHGRPEGYYRAGVLSTVRRGTSGT